ncbi:hypothetical protein E4U41_001108, partial [Claviceps citrina]
MSCSPSTGPPRSEGSTRDADCLLNDLLHVHDDLRTWLEHTGFWDMDYRRAILAGVRHLKGLEAEKTRVLMRMRDSKPGDTAADATALFPVPVAATGIPSLTRAATPTSSALPTSTTGLQARHTPTGPARRQISLRQGFKKDTRYFLVKSSTMTNIIMSQQDNLWITQAKNGPLFTQAFRECRVV